MNEYSLAKVQLFKIHKFISGIPDVPIPEHTRKDSSAPTTARITPVISPIRLFHLEKLFVPVAEISSFTSRKLLFHQQETFVSPARYKSFLQTKQFFCLKDQHVLSFRYSDCKQKIPSP